MKAVPIVSKEFEKRTQRRKVNANSRMLLFSLLIDISVKGRSVKILLLKKFDILFGDFCLFSVYQNKKHK